MATNKFATNKFATMLHKNTHRISVVLIHAVLEWILIVLLLLNSLFSYLITKFAKHFGLQPPCPWCSRLDKFFDPSKPDTSYRDLICEVHAAEISRLGFCSRHGKLAESHDMCEECSPPASEANSNGNSARAGGSFDFFSWVEEMGKISNDGKKNKERVHENGERSSRCSCCEVSLNAKMYTPYWLFKPSWEVVDYIKKENPVEEAPDPPRKSIYLKNHCKNALEIIQDDEDEDEEEEEEEEEDEEEEDEESEVSGEHKIRPDVDECVHVNDSEECLESPIGHRCEKSETDGDGMLDNVEEDDLTLLVKGRNSFRSSRSVMTQLCSTDNVSLEMLPAHLEKWSDHDDHFLVTIESIDSMASEKHDSPEHKKLKNELKEESKPADKVPKLVESADDLSIVLEMETENQCSAKHQSKSRSIELIEEHKSYAENENSSAIYAEDSDSESFCLEVENQVGSTEKAQSMLEKDDTGGVANEVITERSNETPALEENGIEASLVEAETLEGTEISKHKLTDQLQVQDLQIPSLLSLEYHSSVNCNDAKSSTYYGILLTENRQDVKAGKVVVEETTIPAKTIKHGRNHHSPIFRKLDKVEEETALEISNMELDLIDLPKKFLSLEKKESAAEEFKFQSAATTDIDGLERIHDIEHLKSALVAERKVLNALYAELAAERSAAATAANQTINMITKLQEEKASMQMEALQYQQMMEEQSEYDQEALKLLNELMVKREKEKQELEKELEIYRKRVYLYEEKERRILRRRSTNEKSTTPSTSSNSEDSDSANDRQESGKEATTPGDTIQNLDDIGLESSRQLSTLDESLVDFEEERMAILEQLKALEEKLFALDDNEDEGELFEDLRTIESFSAESNGCFNENYEFHSAETNGFSNGHCKSVVGENGQEKRNIDDNAKKLLPLFDAIGMENEDEISLKEEQKCAVPLTKQDSMNSHCTDYNNKLEEEIDHVYQRLQALEADREFLKHCVISLKKGEKGMDLLEEILQHLRDLKNVELRAQKTCDALLL